MNQSALPKEENILKDFKMSDFEEMAAFFTYREKRNEKSINEFQREAKETLANVSRSQMEHNIGYLQCKALLERMAVKVDDQAIKIEEALKLSKKSLDVASSVSHNVEIILEDKRKSDDEKLGMLITSFDELNGKMAVFIDIHTAAKTTWKFGKIAADWSSIGFKVISTTILVVAIVWNTITGRFSDLMNKAQTYVDTHEIFPRKAGK